MYSNSEKIYDQELMLLLLKKLINKTLNSRQNSLITKDSIFEYCKNGFIIEINKEYQYFRWDKISEINVFKRDLVTFDRIEMEIIHEHKSCIINEEMPGWLNFVKKTKENFPKMPQDWDTEIIHPPFETNFRTIYSKK